MSSTTSPTSDQGPVCQAALFHQAGQPLDLQTLPLPQPGDNEAVVQIECCTICGSDLHTVTGARIEPTPSILGHEILGRVTTVGDTPLCDIDGNPLQPGDRITWSACMSCGTCDRCQSGMPQKCRSVAKYGHEVAEGRTALSGGLAEYILLRPGSAVLKVDSSIPDEVACPANCATATVAAAFRSAENLTDQRVLILGAGLLGLTACAFAKSRGAAQVVACDLNPDRLKLAEQFGADTTVVWHADKAERQRLLSDAADGGLFDVVVELSGSPDAVEVACELGDIGARIILVGTVMGSRPVQIDPEAVVRRWLTIRGVHNYTPEDLRTAVRFLEQYHTQFPFAKLVEASFALADINQAIDFAIDKRPVRVAVRP